MPFAVYSHRYPWVCTCSASHVTVQISTGCHGLMITVKLNLVEVMLQLWLLQLLLSQLLLLQLLLLQLLLLQLWLFAAFGSATDAACKSLLVVLVNPMLRQTFAQ